MKKGNLKAIGIVRKVDPLGRVVLPIEIRRTVSIEAKDPVEMFADSEGIYIKKYQPECKFCGTTENISDYKGVSLCERCIKGAELAQKNRHSVSA